ncbi:MAG: AAA family ATPase [Planctomycetes bacterium]|nr:AAA family ATPase [Planctomycetota bacterium]
MQPYYRETADECTLFERSAELGLPLLLKGPTGCGKSRFVEAMAARLERELITVPCHDDTGAADLLGRWLIRGGDTVWQDGPAARAVRRGAILYLDEVAEARPDVLVLLHPLTDHRRSLHLDGTGEVLEAPEGFLLVASYNPGYQSGWKELKPSTRQRFVGLSFDYPDAPIEAEILVGETEVDASVAKQLAGLGQRLRKLDDLGLAEPASTRLLVDAALLIRSGMHPRAACRAAVLEPLTDDPEVLHAMAEVVALCF